MPTRKVIGIGLPKTGTTTLYAALKILGYKHIAGFDMQDCNSYLHGDIERLVAKIKDYDGALDWPWPLMYQSLYRAYPDALFVLTLRENNSTWFKSMQRHAELKRKIKRPPGMRQHIFGYEDPDEAPEHHIQFYNEHNETVRDFFKEKGELVELCWGTDNDWSALCDVLNLDQPSKPFPHENKSSN